MSLEFILLFRNLINFIYTVLVDTAISMLGLFHLYFDIYAVSLLTKIPRQKQYA